MTLQPISFNITQKVTHFQESSLKNPVGLVSIWCSCPLTYSGFACDVPPSYQVNFVSHHTCNHHVGFLFAPGILENLTKWSGTFNLFISQEYQLTHTQLRRYYTSAPYF